MGLDNDPIINVIHRGVKNDIRVLLQNRCYRGAILLTYAGMDLMAYLDMPPSQDEVTSDDFIRWADTYVRFPCAAQLSGVELYGARCASLHSYGTESRRSRAGAVRQIGYMDQSVPEVLSRPTVPHLVLVSVPALVEAFFRGIDGFLVTLFASKAKAGVAEQRFQRIMHELPTADDNGD